MGLYKKFRKYVTGRRLQWPVPYREDRTLEEVYMRDPFVIKDGRGGYVLTGTVYRLNYNDSYGVVIFKSDDKISWRGPFTVVSKDRLGNGYSDFWAPEIHFADGRYFLAVTLKPDGGKRGTYLFVSEEIDGDYRLQCRITPEDKSSLDGTLVFDRGAWWCVYCHEYIDCKDGRIRAVKVTPTFDGICPESDFELFKASDNAYKPAITRYKVTDGPFAYKEKGVLKLLWSTQVRGGDYVQLSASSEDGTLAGRWSQDAPLYTSDGGHGMIFDDYDGTRYLVLHAPNARTVFTREYEHPLFVKL